METIKIVELLRKAEEELLDLPMNLIELAAENDIDTLNTANVISEIADFLESKINKL